MAKNPTSTSDATGGELSVTVDRDAPGTRKVRMVADKMTLTVSELTIAAGVIKMVRHRKVAGEQEQEVIFDELNADEFSMRYAD
jgi:hypothetical protein